MNLRTLCFLPLSLIAFGMPCHAQTGTVTFYSIQPSVKRQLATGMLPVQTLPFTGWLFDSNQRMAHAERGRFMTFRLAAGEHEFTVPYHSDRPGKHPVHLTIEDGGHYCVRLSAKYKSAEPLVPIGIVDSQIEQLPCQQALKEAGRYKPIKVKRVDPAVLAKMDSSSSFPTDN